MKPLKRRYHWLLIALRYPLLLIAFFAKDIDFVFVAGDKAFYVGTVLPDYKCRDK